MAFYISIVAAVIIYILFDYYYNRYKYTKNLRTNLAKYVSKPELIESNNILAKKYEGKFNRLQLRLNRTGKNITAAKYLANSAILYAGVSVAFILSGASLIPALLLSFAVAIIIPHFYVNILISKRNKQFIQMFPDAIDLIIRGVKASLSFQQSVNAIVKEMPEPVSSIFGEVSHSLQLGVDLEPALINAGKRVNITEFDFFTIAVLMQKETGGNLSNVLSNLSETIRERATLKLKVKALSSEARMSTYIIGALPIVVSFVLMNFSPGYLDILVDNFTGMMILGGTIGVFCFGMWVISQMAKLEV